MRNIRDDISLLRTLIGRSKLAQVGLIITVVMVLLIVLAPLYIPYPQDAEGNVVNVVPNPLPPSAAHLFGTDELGRDIFSRTMYGGRFTLGLALAAVFLSLGIGVPIGLVAGMTGGVTDAALMRLTDAFLAIPAILLALVIAASTRGGYIGTVGAVAITGWAFHSRLVRGQVLKIKSEPFVEAATIMGVGKLRMLWRYFLPNTLNIIVVQATIQFGLSVLLIGTLGFLGLGVQLPTPEWGVMISLGELYIRTAWWMSFFPGLFLFISVLGTSLLGDGLRDIIDPRRRQ